MERKIESNNEQYLSYDKTKYNSCICGLQYPSSNTRPDIAYAVNYLVRFLTNLLNEHIQAARQALLRYIAKNPNQGIKVKRNNNKAILEAYIDVDFAADPSTS